MTIPSTLPPHRTYYDPSLWHRLAPKIEAREVELTLILADGRWDEAQARRIVGEIAGMRWVMDMAKELTRIEDEA